MMLWQRTGLFLFVQVAVAGCQLLSPELSMHVLDKCHGRDISLPLTFLCSPYRMWCPVLGQVGKSHSSTHSQTPQIDTEEECPSMMLCRRLPCVEECMESVTTGAGRNEFGVCLTWWLSFKYLSTGGTTSLIGPTSVLPTLCVCHRCSGIAHMAQVPLEPHGSCRGAL